MHSFRGAYPHVWVDTLHYFGEFGVAHSWTTRGTMTVALSLDTLVAVVMRPQICEIVTGAYIVQCLELS